jgi:ATP-dependent Clp protease ATP-binding subunit ClpA
MLERYTDRARRVIDLAQEHATMLNHDYIGTEHLLLGLVGERAGIAARALASLGITAQAARQQVEAITGQGRRAPTGHFAFTPQAAEVLKLSQRQARELGHNYVDTEHLLLGLAGEDDGVAVQVLHGLGSDPAAVRREVIELMLSELLHRININSLERRFPASGQRAGTGPDLSDLDRGLAQVRRDKESAIEAQDFDNAVALRAREMQLLDEQASRHQQSEAAQVERLRDLLRQNGTGPPGDVP